MKNSTIEKTPWSKKDKGEREYIIDAGEVRGVVAITADFIKELHLSHGIEEKIRRKFNIKDEDILVELEWFFPNILKDPKQGTSIEYSEMRAGRGGKILEEIELDMKLEGKKVLFCMTAETSMINFLNKKGFQELLTSTFPQRYFIKEII